MTSSKVSPLSLAHHRMKRLPCAACGNTMKLLCVEPENPDLDRQTFQCEICKALASVTVSSDPMVSEGNGWAASHLHAPR